MNTKSNKIFAVVLCGLFLLSIFAFVFVPPTADNTHSSSVEESDTTVSVEEDTTSEMEESQVESEIDSSEESTITEEEVSDLEESVDSETSISDNETSEEESEPDRFPQGVIPPQDPEETIPDIITDLNVVLYNSESTDYNPIDGRRYIEDIVYYLDKYAPEGMFISAASAMAYTEGGAGKKGIYVSTNNCFGIRAYSNWDGYVYSRSTGRVYKDYKTAMMYGAKDNFRAYDCMEDSVKDYVALISTDYYNTALTKDTPAEYIDYILKQGYGEYELYDMWLYLIDLYDLEQYDVVEDTTIDE